LLDPWGLDTIKDMSTAAEFPLESLTVPEKLVLLERIWDDLSRRPSDVPVPDWHGDVLAERRAAVEAGKTSFVAWEDAKARLRERLR